MPSSMTPSGIAYDRGGPPGATPVVLLHAGVADRRMWDPQWAALTAARDAVRLDLRGFGESDRPPVGALDPVGDVLDTLDHLGVTACHLVGSSFGAGVAVEVALTRPARALAAARAARRQPAHRADPGPRRLRRRRERGHGAR